MTPQIRLLAIREVKHKTSLGTTCIYERMKSDKFPQPLKLGDRCVRWLENEIDDWIIARAAERTDRCREARNV